MHASPSVLSQNKPTTEYRLQCVLVIIGKSIAWLVGRLYGCLVIWLDVVVVYTIILSLGQYYYYPSLLRTC